MNGEGLVIVKIYWKHIHIFENSIDKYRNTKFEATLSSNIKNLMDANEFIQQIGIDCLSSFKKK